MNRHNRRTIAASTLVLLGLVGCSGGSKSTAEPPTSNPAIATATTLPIDPCDLVTQAQAEALTGTSLLAGLAVRTDVPTDRTCTYTQEPDSPEAQVQVLLGAGAKQALDTDRGLGRAFTDVPLIGHEAHEETGALFFRKKDTWVAIRVSGGDDPKVVGPRLRALAHEISPRV